jgi:hypothetical protein
MRFVCIERAALIDDNCNFNNLADDNHPVDVVSYESKSLDRFGLCILSNSTPTPSSGFLLKKKKV